MTRWLALVFALACEESPPRPPPAPRALPGPQVHELTAESNPGQVDDTLIAHIQDERYERAYALMSSAYRASVTLERFRESVSANPYLKTTTLIGCSHIQTFDDGVQVRDCILRSEAGNAFAQLFYAREDEGWRMTGMLIGGTPAFPTPMASDRPSSPSAVHDPWAPAPTPTPRSGTEVLDPWR